MTIERKADFLDQFTSHIFFGFQVLFENPIALFGLCIILLVGLYVGVKQEYIYRKKKPWTEQNKKDLKIVVLLFIVIAVIFYLVNKI